MNKLTMEMLTHKHYNDHTIYSHGVYYGFVNRDINHQDTDGYTPLIKASAIGDRRMVKLLIENGADVNIQNNYGDTALIRASERGHLKIVKLLINRGASPYHQNRKGDDALTISYINKELAVAKFLEKVVKRGK